VNEVLAWNRTRQDSKGLRQNSLDFLANMLAKPKEAKTIQQDGQSVQVVALSRKQVKWLDDLLSRTMKEASSPGTGYAKENR
jgi:hypothetical protein